MSELYFRPDKLKGFTSSDSADKNEGYAIPIRELLQNGLDASRQAKNAKCEIDIYIETIPTAKIPCLDGYKRALEKAIDTQKNKASYGPNAKQVVNFINDELGKKHVDVLMFVDNGKGMNSEAIGALFDERSRGKDEDGGDPLGSFGVGHLTGYMLSSLRYMLYATKYRVKNGKIQSLFTVSPILAGHVDKNPAAERSGSGRIVRAKPDDELMPEFDYPNEFPDFLAPKMREIETGTLVTILGLSEQWNEEAEYAIAGNFFHAIYKGELNVTIHTKGAEAKCIDSRKAEELINTGKESKNAMGENILSGKAVYHCWHAINDAPVEITLNQRNKVSVYIKTDEEADSAIVLVRNGMLIARHDSMLSGAMNSLRKNSDYEPFTAVIDLNQDAPDLFELVRGAENKNHNKLEKNRLSKKGTKDLQNYLKDLSEQIALHLRKLDGGYVDLPLFPNHDESAKISGGGGDNTQGKKARPVGEKQSHQSKKKRKKKSKKKRVKPSAVNRSSDSISRKRYVENKSTWTVRLEVDSLKKEVSDEAYLSVRLAEDRDTEKASTILHFQSVSCNGAPVDIPVDHPNRPLLLKNLKDGESYTIIAEVKKPNTLVGTKVALVPVLGLKRKVTRNPQENDHA